MLHHRLHHKSVTTGLVIADSNLVDPTRAAVGTGLCLGIRPRQPDSAHEQAEAQAAAGCPAQSPACNRSRARPHDTQAQKQGMIQQAGRRW